MRGQSNSKLSVNLNPSNPSFAPGGLLMLCHPPVGIFRGGQPAPAPGEADWPVSARQSASSERLRTKNPRIYGEGLRLLWTKKDLRKEDYIS